MGLLDWVRKYSNGDTPSQVQARAQRANARSTDYMQVVQWSIENTDHLPLELTSYADAGAKCTFKAGHTAKLLGYKSDIERKTGHLAGRQELVMKGFRRGDGTVFCIYVGIRDNTQNFVLLKPYWFLASGETEAGFRSDPVNMINVVRR
ncbi:MAG: hypothetical protein JWO38_669 [Gemmataceae bacterium]|nr:hypothetical protein [Gemmataceae bacterium]